MLDPVIADEQFRRALEAKRGPDLVKALVSELSVLRQQCAALAQTVQVLKTAQDFGRHMIERAAPADSALPLPDRICIQAHQLFDPQDGFYNTEYDQDGRPFRWTGPQRHFSFVLCIDRSSPLTVELEALSLIDETRQRDMTLLVDGTVTAFRLLPDPAGYIGRIELPPGHQADRVQFTFLVPHVLPPAGNGDDTRILGIAFRSLTVTAAAKADPLPAVSDAAMADPDTVAPSRAAILPTRFVCTAADIADENPYFFPLEWDPEGRPCRHRRQDGFVIEAAVDRGRPLEIRLSFVATQTTPYYPRLLLDIDDAPCPLELQPAGSQLDAWGILPPRSGHGITRLDVTVSDGDAEPDAALRSGFALYAVQIGPKGARQRASANPETTASPEAPNPETPGPKVPGTTRRGSRRAAATARPPAHAVSSGI